MYIVQENEGWHWANLIEFDIGELEKAKDYGLNYYTKWRVPTRIVTITILAEFTS